MSIKENYEQVAKAAGWYLNKTTVFIFLLFILYTVAGFRVSRPLIANISRALPMGTIPIKGEGPAQKSGDEDTYQLYFYNWLFFDSVTQLRNPLGNIYEFGELNANHWHRMGLWGFPLQLFFLIFSIFGFITAYNLIVILSFPLTALVQYAFLREFGIRKLWAAMGGLLYAFALSRLVQMYSGHANGFLYFHLPLTALFILKAIKLRSRRAAVLAGAALLMTALGEWHNLYYSSLFLGLFTLYVLISVHLYGAKNEILLRLSRLIRNRRLLQTLALLAGGEFLALLYGLIMKNAFIADSIAEGHRGLISAPLENLFFKKFYLQNVISGANDIERSVYLGAATLIVLLIVILFLAVVLTKNYRLQAEVRENESDPGVPDPVWFFSLVFFVFTLLSLGGPGMRIMDLYRMLYDYFPFWKISRVAPRMIYIAHFALSFLFAYFLHNFQKISVRLPQQFRTISRLILTVAFLWPVYDLVIQSARVNMVAPPAPGPAVIRRIGSAPAAADSAILYLPVYRSGHSANSYWEYYTTIFRRPFLNGYSPVAPRKAEILLRKLQSMNRGRLTGDEINELKANRIGLIMYDSRIRFHRPPEGGIDLDFIKRLERTGHLKEEVRENGITLYSLKNRQ